MPKLVIQIPCYNEAESLPGTLRDLPREVEGFDRVEWLVIDDGSTDGTAAEAHRCGVDHVVCIGRHVGLARAFALGLEAGLALGADVIVNTDADNQYRGADIPLLTGPVLAGEADMVVGERPIGRTDHFSLRKKLLQRIGSWVVRRSSGTQVADAASGFRAFSRELAQELKVFNGYSYTIETIIQAGHKGYSVLSVPIRTNPPVRSSRLVKSSARYVWRQALTVVRIFMTYRPFAFFAAPGAVTFAVGFLVGLRFLIAWLGSEGSGMVQSLILAALLMGTGSSLILIGLVADLMAVNRILLEGIDARLRRVEESVRDPTRP